MALRLTPDEVAFLVRRYAEGRSIRQIAAEAKMGYASVHSALLDAGVTLRSRRGANARTSLGRAPGVDEHTAAEMVELYTRELLSVREIATRYGMSYGRVYRALTASGVKLRPRGRVAK